MNATASFSSERVIAREYLPSFAGLDLLLLNGENSFTVVETRK